MKLLPISLLLAAVSVPLASGQSIRGHKEISGNADNVVTSRDVQPPGRSLSSKDKARVIDYPPNGIELGQGWDSTYANRKETVGIIFEEETSSLGQIKTQEYTKVTDTSRLMQAMDISADFQYSGITGSASGKFKFASKVKVLSTSQNFVARAKVENGRTYTAPATHANGYKEVRLTPHALALAESDLEEFYRVYGDSFVSAIHLGAELDAALTFAERERENIVELETNISGSGWGFSGSSGFKATVESYSKRNQLKVQYFQTGGSGDPIPTDVDGFLQKISELPQLAATAPYPHSVTLQRYETLPNWPQGALPKRPSSYEKMLRRYFEYKSLISDIADVEENSEDFLLDRGTDLDKIRDSKQELHEGIRVLEKTLLDFKYGTITELPSIPITPDYDFRVNMPIPMSYNTMVGPDIDSGKLKEFVTNFWLRQVSDNRCKYRGYNDEGCLSPDQLKTYSSQIVVTDPLRLTFESIVVPHDGLWGGSGYTLVGDFNGDGKKDIVSASGNRNFLKQGTNSGFVSKTVLTDGRWGGSGYTWVGDFNGDGKDDIASASGGNIYLKSGTYSGFSSATWSVVGHWGGSGYTWVGDFNGDGKDDIASASGRNIFLKLGKSQGFESRTVITDGYWGGSSYTWVGDFDGDGKDDVASASGNRIFLKRGTSTGFQSETYYIDGHWGGSGYTWVGDFNGDGKDDIASASGNRIFLKLGKGSGFESKTVYTDGNWGGSGYTWVGDFDGDGKSDIASASGNRIFLKRGTDSGFESETFLTDGRWGGSSYSWVGDFNGDGREDIASGNGNQIYLKAAVMQLAD